DLGKVVRDLVDPGNAESPLGRLGGELKQVRTALDGVTKQMAVEHAASHASAKVFELTAVKGRGFEEVVFEAVGEFAALYVDKQEMDSYALRLALMTARFAIKRQSSGHGDHLDVGGALTLIEEGQRELASHATIKRCHSMARKQIDAATTHTADLVLRMDAIF